MLKNLGEEAAGARGEGRGEMGKELDLLSGQPLQRGPAVVRMEARRSVRRALPAFQGDSGMCRLCG